MRLVKVVTEVGCLVVGGGLAYIGVTRNIDLVTVTGFATTLYPIAETIRSFDDIKDLFPSRKERKYLD
ncbi:MAG: hypothetical protein Q7S06_01800 [Nanoarchaeota archaeon]|nr:hypothetical protein [Nanoarchaeota archaeon]